VFIDHTAPFTKATAQNQSFSSSVGQGPTCGNSRKRGFDADSVGVAHRLRANVNRQFTSIYARRL